MKILIIIFLFLISVASVEAHSGGLDSYGGHNCRVGACAGTYHYHRYIPPPIYYYNTPTPKPPTPTPTLTPTPTAVPTTTPWVIVETVEEPKNGIWEFIMSIFRLLIGEKK